MNIREKFQKISSQNHFFIHQQYSKEFHFFSHIQKYIFNDYSKI